LWRVCPQKLEAAKLIRKISLIEKKLAVSPTQQRLFKPIPENRIEFKQPDINAFLFSYWDKQVTNAYPEAINGVAKGTNRMGRGYNFDVIRARLLYKPRSACGDGSKDPISMLFVPAKMLEGGIFDDWCLMTLE
jgi:hypothetical protein